MFEFDKGRSSRCNFAPKPSVDGILRATGGVLPALAIRAIRHCWKYLQHPETA